MSVRTLIVDDERLARARIIKLLQSHDDITIIGECKNGNEAIEDINNKKPDLIFLDIQMPDIDGFAVVTEADISYNPIIIFATAYDQYAIKAFDVNAVDYLLKPFDSERFDKATDRAKAFIKLKKNNEFNNKLVGMLKDYYNETEKYTKKFEIKESGKIKRVYAEDIYYISSEGNYVYFNLEEKKVLYRITMNALEIELDPEQFLRIHRSLIVNKNCIKTIRYITENNKYKFILKNGDSIESGRSYKDKIAEFLSQTTIL